MTDTPITHPLSPRLRELSDAVTQGREAVAREFTMRVPAEPNRDADLVLSRAADELDRQTAEFARLLAEVYRLRMLCQTAHDRLLRGDSDRALLDMLETAWTEKLTAEPPNAAIGARTPEGRSDG